MSDSRKGKHSKRVLIIGCGRLGSHLAERLSSSGHQVTVVDKDLRSFNAIDPARFSGFRIEGDASEAGVLRRAEIDRADLFIAATCEDNLNIMVALIARDIYHVPRVLARVYDPRREETYRQIGLATVCPTTMAARVFEDMILEADAVRGGHKA